MLLTAIMDDGKLMLLFKIRPHPKGRPRFARGGHAFTDKKTRDFEKQIRELAAAQWTKPPLAGPLKVAINFYYKRPKSDPNRQWHSQRPDIDNLAKSVLDSVEGQLFCCDSQICDLRLWKGYADQEYITLHLESLASPQ